jgi:toxin secretion/phage lysis holin
LVLQCLVTMVIIDYITGVLAAYTTKRLSSSVGYRGLIKKLCIFLMVAMATVLDSITGGPEPYIRTTVIWFFIANEALSALENMGEMGVPLPGPLIAALEKLHKDHTSEKR